MGAIEVEATYWCSCSEEHRVETVQVFYPTHMSSDELLAALDGEIEVCMAWEEEMVVYSRLVAFRDAGQLRITWLHGMGERDLLLFGVRQFGRRERLGWDWIYGDAVERFARRYRDE